MSIEIVNGRVFVEGKETVDPAFIGYVILDLAEEKQNIALVPVGDWTCAGILYKTTDEKVDH
jgi:hypothetical protein